MAVTKYPTFDEWLKNRTNAAQSGYKKKTEHLDSQRTSAYDTADITYAAAEQLAKNNYNTEVGLAESTKNSAIEKAGTARDVSYAEADKLLEAQKGDAKNAFARSQVTYGQAAENLGRAGLTGSGVSDNLTRDVYAQRAEALAAANAEHGAAREAAGLAYNDAVSGAEVKYNEEVGNATLKRDNALVLAELEQKTAKKDADTKYSEGFLKAEQELESDTAKIEELGIKYAEEKASAIEDAIASVRDGTMTASDIDRLESRGIDVSAIRAEYANVTKNTADAIGKEIENSLTTPDANGEITPAYTLADIDALVRSGKITPEQGEELKHKTFSIADKALSTALDASYAVSDKNSADGKERIKDVDDAIHDVIQLWQSGYISDADYQKAADAYNKWLYEYIDSDSRQRTIEKVAEIDKTNGMGGISDLGMPTLQDRLSDSRASAASGAPLSGNNYDLPKSILEKVKGKGYQVPNHQKQVVEQILNNVEKGLVSEGEAIAYLQRYLQ